MTEKEFNLQIIAKLEAAAKEVFSHIINVRVNKYGYEHTSKRDFTAAELGGTENFVFEDEYEPNKITITNGSFQCTVTSTSVFRALYKLYRAFGIGTARRITFRNKITTDCNVNEITKDLCELKKQDVRSKKSKKAITIKKKIIRLLERCAMSEGVARILRAHGEKNAKAFHLTPGIGIQANYYPSDIGCGNWSVCYIDHCYNLLDPDAELEDIMDHIAGIRFKMCYRTAVHKYDILFNKINFTDY